MMKRFYTFFVVALALSGWLNVADAAPGPKIEGPWLWMVVPTVHGGDAAAASGEDYLAAASGGTVTEQQIATTGATAGDAVGDSVWTSGSLAPTGGNNINDLVNAIGFSDGGINMNNHVAYGSIVLNSPREQNTKMWVGSDDAAKIWLNGTLVHTEGLGVTRGTNNYWEAFPVTLKKGKNILFVAVYYQYGGWSGFFGFEDDAVYTVLDAPSEPEVSVPVPKPKASVSGPKIEGPWLWMIAPMGDTDYIETDWLAKASDGTVTEQQIATQGATEGVAVGDKVWTSGSLAPTGSNNINDLMNTIGFSEDDINSHVAYGSIVLNAPRQQNTKMYIGSSRPIQVWLNGTLVRVSSLFGAAEDYKNGFSVTLKKDKNALFIAIYNIKGELQSGWSGFFGFEENTDYTLYQPPVVHVPLAERSPLYWIDKTAGTLHRLVEEEVEDIVIDVQNATCLAVDTTNSKLYWGEKTGKQKGRIRRANLDGTNIQLVKALTSVPVDFALDTAGQKLYLINAWGKVQRMNFDGSNFQSNLITNLASPDHLVLDVPGGKVYWTEQTGKTTGKIQRANLDGSNVELVKSLTSVPHGLDIDTLNKKLYLTNAWGKVQHLNFNGANYRSNFITDLESPDDLAVDASGGKVYWTEMSGSIRRADLNGENIEDLVTRAGMPIKLALDISPVPVAVAAAPAKAGIPDQTLLFANYPNPFNPETWIPYQLAVPTDVKLTIYDARGVLIRHLELGHQLAGTYTSRSRAAYWDGRNTQGERVASGVYFYRLQTDTLSSLRKMVILK